MQENSSILLPLTYLGPVSYFASIVNTRKVNIELHEHYLKQTCRNRCRIATANGLLDLIIPVKKVNGNHTSIRDMAIVNQGKWQLNHWRAIESAYNNAPYFLFYKDELESFYRENYHSLSDFNSKQLKLVLGQIGCQVEISFTSEYKRQVEAGMQDFRNAFNPKKTISQGFPEYTQVFSDKFGFQPDLSIIDLIFNMGPDSMQYLEMLKNREIVA